jgi:hypothetical protein
MGGGGPGLKIDFRTIVGFKDTAHHLGGGFNRLFRREERNFPMGRLQGGAHGAEGRSHHRAEIRRNARARGQALVQ